MMDTKNYGFYNVKLVGTDDTEVVIGSSLESVKAEMEEMYGDLVDSVTEVAGEDLTSEEPKDGFARHNDNVSILSGRNPFEKENTEMSKLTQFTTQKEKLKV